MHKSDTQTQRQIFTVAKLNHYTKRIIEGRFPLLWIEGEVSNLTKANSGHWYFTLKDEHAQVRCIMFRQAVIRSNCAVENGDKVLVNAQASFFEPRGDFQLNVEVLEEAGIGALQRAYQQLYNKLQLEGLFDTTHKKALDSYPNHVVIITSATGAAIHDLKIVFKQRCPLTEITVIPAQVQGKQAPESLIKALARAEQLEGVDAIIIGRGGGSLEDLWAFNDEKLARAIHQCSKLIVSAVGHESDITISDYVADVRAATPSQAAELLSPNIREWEQNVKNLTLRLVTAAHKRIQLKNDSVRVARQSLKHPLKYIQALEQRLDLAALKLQTVLQSKKQQYAARTDTLIQQLFHVSPKQALRDNERYLEKLNLRLETSLNHNLNTLKSRFVVCTARLDSASPLAILARGYGFTTRDGDVITRADQTKTGDCLTINWQDGSRNVKVIK